MKSTELRIGNILSNRDDDIFELSGFYLYQLTIEENTTGIITSDKPILLTEEWLQKLGFFKYNNVYVLEKPKENTLDFIFSVWQDMTYNSGEFPVKLVYVHQLQNLYFALIGSELQLVAQAAAKLII